MSSEALVDVEETMKMEELSGALAEIKESMSSARQVVKSLNERYV